MRRNPWDEPECGHHYARAMSSWSGMLALSGFRYAGPERRVIAAPRAALPFQLVLVGGPGWGYVHARAAPLLAGRRPKGSLPVERVEFTGPAARVEGAAAARRHSRQGDRIVVTFRDVVISSAGKELVIQA